VETLLLEPLETAPGRPSTTITALPRLLTSPFPRLWEILPPVFLCLVFSFFMSLFRRLLRSPGGPLALRSEAIPVVVDFRLLHLSSSWI